VHPFLSSIGTRYLPWFGAESLLVESFSETDPDAHTLLLDFFVLPQRRGVTRLTLEDALRSRGMALCAELGLDPIEYVVTCIPFDVYSRLAPQQGWGRQERWTHFDGYQVTRDLAVHALVGGDARHGGPDDFCTVQRDYDSVRITTRLSVLRRERFLVRQIPEPPTGPER
jgi:hypothetical protein